MGRLPARSEGAEERRKSLAADAWASYGKVRSHYRHVHRIEQHPGPEVAAGRSDLEAHGRLGMRLDIRAPCAPRRLDALMAWPAQHPASAKIELAPDILADHKRDQPQPFGPIPRCAEGGAGPSS